MRAFKYILYFALAMIGCIAAAVVTGFATRPPSGSLRQDWLILFLFGGAAAGLLLLALRKVLRKP